MEIIIIYLKFQTLNTPDEKHLFEGKIETSKRPVRHRLSTERCSLSKYPFDAFPPGIVSDSYLMSREVVQHFAIVAPFVEYVEKEDIFLGIIAYRLGLAPRQNPYFCYTRPTYSRDLYKNCLVLHFKGKFQDKIRIWNDQIAYMAELKVIPDEYVAQLLVPSPLWNVLEIPNNLH